MSQEIEWKMLHEHQCIKKNHNYFSNLLFSLDKIYTGPSASMSAMATDKIKLNWVSLEYKRWCHLKLNN